MAPCTEEQRDFVNRHVKVFSDRHRAKLGHAFPMKTPEAIIQESGNAELIEAVTRFNLLEDELTTLQNRMAEAAEKFNKEFGPTVDQLVKDADMTRVTELQEKQDAFDYRLRTAIGLVELVSPERAYEVLEQCRQEIEQLGKE